MPSIKILNNFCFLSSFELIIFVMGPKMFREVQITCETIASRNFNKMGKPFKNIPIKFVQDSEQHF